MPHDRFQHFVHADPALRADGDGVVRWNRQHIFDLLFHVVRPRRRQIDLVDDRNNRQIVPRGEECVGHRLRFDALARVHHQQRALAGRKRARNFVRKIDVPRRVDQIQPVLVPVPRVVMQANAFRLDGDAALALQIHGVEHLRGHLALREGAGALEQAVGQRGFPVVDVCDDAEIPNVLGIHGSLCDCASSPRAIIPARAACAPQTIECATVSRARPPPSPIATLGSASSAAVSRR